MLKSIVGNLIAMLSAILGPYQWILITLSIALVALYTKCLFNIWKMESTLLTKIFWLIVVFAFPVFGVLFYYVLRNQIVIHATHSSM